MTRPDLVVLGARLIKGDDALGRALRQMQQERPSAAQEARAFDRLQHRIGQAERWRWRSPALVLAIAISVVSLFVLYVGSSRKRPASTASAASAIPVFRQLDELFRPLAAGPQSLDDGTLVHLSDVGQAKVRRLPTQGIVVELQRGSLDSSVPRQREREAYEVRGGGYRFRVLGTRFRVSLDAQATRLDVSEGKVEILQGEQRIALVSAGGTWQGTRLEIEGQSGPAQPGDPSGQTGLVDAGTPKESANSPSNAVPTLQHANCLELAREGTSKQALACFEREAQGSGLGAEVAQYEIARLRRDVLGDPRGALKELHTYTRRYPHGTFNTEARLSIVQLLASLGRTSEALRDSEELIRSGAAKERTLELRLLRGNLYRRAGNCTQAKLELAVVIESKSPLAEQAQHLIAGCRDAQMNPSL